jgi:FdhD protein
LVSLDDVHEAPVRRATTPVRVRAIDADGAHERPDRLVTEEPMEIRLQGPDGEATSVAVTMRTPGSDFELAVGFLLTEGVLRSADDVASVAYCLEGDGTQQYNVVTVRTHQPVDGDLAPRAFPVGSSCGVCGKASLDAVAVRCGPVASGPTVARSTLVALPHRLRSEQAVFDSTGGLHAAACFTASGELAVLREDVGRHNAVDKVVGHAAIQDLLPLSGHVLLVSGRLSFEIVQKAAVAGIPILCAVSAPSSLAVDAARRFEQTIVGFLRDDRFNVYCGDARIDTSS